MYVAHRCAVIGLDGSKNMNSIELTVETLTPLFLGGADPRGELSNGQFAVELRAPAMRGMLRYWLRAVLGNKDAKELYKQESVVFGGVGKEIATCSPVVVRLANGFHQKDVKDYKPQGNTAATQTGQDYLYWSMNKNGDLPARKYFSSGVQFKLKMHSLSTDALRQAFGAAILAVHLGGIGSRSRRTAGSLAVVDASNDVMKFFEAQDSAVLLAQYLSKVVIPDVRKMFDTNRAPQIQAPSPYAILNPNTCRVWVLPDAYESVSEATNAIGNALRKFRGTLEFKQVGLLGLPHPNGPKGRQSSPLWLKLSRLKDGNLVVVATLFKNRLYGNSSSDYKAGGELVAGFKSL
jgi:CRISPR-associated protein Cmr1